jgi:Ran-binding protein 3
MHDAPNGADNNAGSEQSASGSEGGRGRLRRKRSREDFEEDEKDRPTEKKERHVRKKSRDVTSPKPTDADTTVRPLNSSVSRIDEQDGDDKMSNNDSTGDSKNSAANGRATPPPATSDKDESTSPKNKRTREQASSGETAGLDESVNEPASTEGDNKSHEEPKAKRPREKDDLQSEEPAKVSEYTS